MYLLILWANFRLILNLKKIIEKNLNQTIIDKNGPKQFNKQLNQLVLKENTFSVPTFCTQLFLQIQNKHKILNFCIPHMTLL